MSLSKSVTGIEPSLTVHVLAATAVDGTVEQWTQDGLTVRVIEGGRCRTLGDLYREFASAVPFPDYFADNKDSFTEWLTSFDGVGAGAGIVLVIIDPDQLLAEQADEFTWFRRTLDRAHQRWTQPVTRGPGRRDAVPFSVVLATESGSDPNRPWESES